MRSKLNQLWLIAGTIWLAAIIMTYWNCDTIDAIVKTRDNGERLRKEYLFQRRNAERFLHVQKIYASYSQPVASVNLGFESIRSRLYALASDLGLSNVRIESKMAQATQTQIPISVRMQGDYEKARRFASALRIYSFLSIKHSRVSVLNAKGEAEIEMALIFQFTLELPNQSDHPPFQTSASTTAREG